VNELIPILEQVIKTGKQLLIIASDIDNELLATLVLNKVNGNLPVTVTKAPAFAEKRRQLLEDICTITGATLVSDDLGNTLNNATLEWLGEAKSIVVTKDNTTIVGGNGNKEKIQALKISLSEQLKESSDPYTTDIIKNRLAKISNGVAVIHAGASSEIEIKELKLRIEDALSATKAASEEGIVSGGGSTLLYLSNILKDFPKSLDNEEEQIGAKILLEAIREPIRQIAINSGANPGEVEYLTSQKNSSSWGYNALKGEYTDMIQSGIIDPAKVTRCALENASSVAATLITTSSLISNESDNQNK
jgi:chaperonin GroEL